MLVEVECQIRWIDKTGFKTPDSNPAVLLVRTKRRFEWAEWDNTRLLEFQASTWFPICAEHAKRLCEPGMEHWESKPFYQKREVRK